MGKPILYGATLSPPVRAVQLTCKEIGLDIEFRVVDILNKAHLSEDFLKKNPQHTIPVLEDDGKYLWDSHAIATYLIGKYAKNDSLYPKDLYQRAVVDQRLHFDSGVLFAKLRLITGGIFFKKEKTIAKEKIDGLYEAYDFVEKFLEGKDYVCGKTLTVADFCCIATISSFQSLAPIDASKCPKVVSWMKRMALLPYFHEINEVPAEALCQLITKTIKEN